jgi:HD-GYP domain-containing protein (c-di-GMP phosphodiesterase class II)
MYIQSLEGSWFDHPFWRSKFLLEEMDDLRTLQSSDIESVWVDDEKSLAPAMAHLGVTAPVPVTEELSPREALLQELNGAKPVKAVAASAAPKPARRVSAPNEFQAAERVLEDCKAAVGELFAQIQSGHGEKAIEDAGPVISGIADSVDRNPDALITLVRVRTLDEYTYMHSIAVSALMINLARQLQLPPDYVKQAGTAGLFMDVGKAFLPPELLSTRAQNPQADWTQMYQVLAALVLAFA